MSDALEKYRQERDKSLDKERKRLEALEEENGSLSVDDAMELDRIRETQHRIYNEKADQERQAEWQKKILTL